MSGTFMRTLMESVLLEAKHPNLDALERDLGWLENHPQEAMAKLEKRGGRWELENERKLQYKQEVRTYKKAIEKWQAVLDNSETVNQSVHVNPMNPRTTATIGDGELGKIGSADEVVQWLNTYLPAKGKSVAKNLATMEQVSPEPITWSEGVATITPVGPTRGARMFTTEKKVFTPGAHVLIIGETESGDDVRFMFYQGTTSEGSARISIANGKAFKSGNFTKFADEL